MMTDPIADMLTCIRNAVRIERPQVELPLSKVKRGLAEVLKREGYIWDWREARPRFTFDSGRSEEHMSELQSPCNLVCRLLLEKKKHTNKRRHNTKQH